MASLLFSLCIVTPLGAQAQTPETWQQTSKFLPSNPTTWADFFGTAVSIDDDTAVVGAPYNDLTDRDSGAAYVLARSGGVWTQQQMLTASDTGRQAHFGTSVAVDGDTIVVGAPEATHLGQASYGVAYVFVRNGNTWVQQQKITVDDIDVGEQFGISVSLDGDSLVVGASGANLVGAAYVFSRSGGVWNQQQKLTASDAWSADYFGSAVSMSGDTVVVGAYRDDDGGSSSGSAYVFVRNAGAWTEQQKLTASDAASANAFGRAVSVNDDTVLIGAPRNNSFGPGHAYVFTRAGVTWTEQQKLTPSDSQTADYFGWSVGLSGSTAVIGARRAGGMGDGGSAYVFTPSGNVWSEQSKLVDPDLQLGDEFGSAVGVTGDTIVVGSSGDDDNGNFSGSGFFFDRSGVNWNLSGKVVAIGDHENNQFGYSVDIDGDTAVVSAHKDRVAGSVYVFARTAGAWSLEQRLVGSDTGANDDFGASVSIDGNTVAVGVPDASVDGSAQVGAVYVFTRSGMTWTEQQKLISAGTQFENFGASVSLDGDTLIVGNPEDNDVGEDLGSVHVFTRSGGAWAEQQKLVASGPSSDDLNFGRAISLQDDTVVIGAYREDGSGFDQGAAYVFTRSGGTWSEQQKLTASDAINDQNFGEALALDGDTLAIGSPRDDDSGARSGSVYIFSRSGGTWTEMQKLVADDGAAEDLFGGAVSVEADTLIVGSTGDDDNGSWSGSAYIFARQGGTWDQHDKLSAADAAPGAILGAAVAVSGSDLLIGASGDSEYGDNAGAAYMFSLVDNTPNPGNGNGNGGNSAPGTAGQPKGEWHGGGTCTVGGTSDNASVLWLLMAVSIAFVRRRSH